MSAPIIIDIRRDNLLLHLLFKALFAQARTRVEYLALLTGRGPPEDVSSWSTKSIDEIVKYIDAAKPLPSERLRDLHTRLMETVRSFGVPMTDAERVAIDSFHRRFIDAGLSLQFNTTGRSPQFDYPTYRDLILEVDRQRTRQNVLASEESFQFVKTMHAQDRIVPIVGDLSGTTALAAVATFLTTSHQQVTAFYTSNVEFYLFRDGGFPRFMRSIFPSGGTGLAPPAGYNCTLLTQPIQTLLDGRASGRFTQYWELARGGS